MNPIAIMQNVIEIATFLTSLNFLLGLIIGGLIMYALKEKVKKEIKEIH